MKLIRILSLLLFLSPASAQIMMQAVANSAPPAGGGQVATPTYDNDTGTYSLTVSVAISDSTAGAAITYCTQVGSNCSPVGGTSYTVPVVITNVGTGTHLCSYATHAGMTDSATKCGTYTVNPITDAFTGTDGTPIQTHDAHWIRNNSPNTFTIIGNKIDTGGNTGVATVHWNATFTNNQYAQVVVAPVAAAVYLGPAVRVQTSANTCYMVLCNTSNCFLQRRTTGSDVTLATLTAVLTGHTVRLEVSGTSLTVKDNGSTMTGTPVTDSNISSGFAGMASFGASSTTPTLDNFEGGDL